MLRQVAHPNIVATYDVAMDDDGTPAIIMELLQGESLADRLGRQRYLSIGQTSAILARVAAGVHAAHGLGVVHRDLKPDNVFLRTNASGATDVRVLDFGVAKRTELSPEKLTETGTLVERPITCRQSRLPARGVDERTDVWAMSVIAFECVTGGMPVIAENYGQLLSALIRHDVRKLGEVRPDPPADFAAAIDAGLAERQRRPSHSTSSWPPLARTPTRRLRRRRRRFLFCTTPPFGRLTPIRGLGGRADDYRAALGLEGSPSRVPRLRPRAIR